MFSSDVRKIFTDTFHHSMQILAIDDYRSHLNLNLDAMFHWCVLEFVVCCVDFDRCFMIFVMLGFFIMYFFAIFSCKYRAIN